VEKTTWYCVISPWAPARLIGARRVIILTGLFHLQLLTTPGPRWREPRRRRGTSRLGTGGGWLGEVAPKLGLDSSAFLDKDDESNLLLVGDPDLVLVRRENQAWL
jgi:hypothetical protein